MKKTGMTDREIIQFLRGHMRIGHTDGKPFESACVTLQLNSYGLYSMVTIMEMIDHLSAIQALDHPLSPTDKFVIQILKDSGVLSGFIALSDLNEQMKKESES